jgi:DNA (cytosine-5)-methyltransferase 1
VRLAEPLLDPTEDQVAAEFDRHVLLRRSKLASGGSGEKIRIADLFSGAGLLTLGIEQACEALGLVAEPVIAVDANLEPLSAYARNFQGARTLHARIESLVDRPFDARPSRNEAELTGAAGRIDVLVGGPPCQGHSDLNNHTRRDDPKNRLYKRMARFAQLVEPTHILIENVPAVRHDKEGVVGDVVKKLERLGYHVAQGVAPLARVGVPQLRRRHVVLASKEHSLDFGSVIDSYARPERSVKWAIGDLAKTRPTSAFDEPSKPTEESTRRINYLFDANEYDLPDALRPDCHRLRAHSYRSVYGRLRPNAPAQTITSGFGCMGQGRFVHPTKRRTLTPHEAARLQMIPDYFDFSDIRKRTALAEAIGNAVPPKLAYVFGLELLR